MTEPKVVIVGNVRLLQVGWYDDTFKRFNRLYEVGPKAGVQPVYIMQESFTEPAFPENANYGCVDCGSINHTTGDVAWCRVAQARQEGES